MLHKVAELNPQTVEVSHQAELPAKPVRSWLRRALWILLVVIGFVLCVLRWGGDALISGDPLPAHLDATVVLQGSVLGERARVAGAVQLLRKGRAGRLLLSIPKESYWGQPVAPLAYKYIEDTYGEEIANRTDFCESGLDVNSTQQEAVVLAGCIAQHGWSSVAVVTSTYHTRRAGIIWRRTLRQQNSPVRLWIYGVDDPEFRADGWWRERLWAKTWVGESTKLLWMFIDFLFQSNHAV